MGKCLFRSLFSLALFLSPKGEWTDTVCMRSVECFGEVERETEEWDRESLIGERERERELELDMFGYWLKSYV